MLKDIAKVLVGVVATKIGFCIWLITANMLPINILGLEWSFAPNMISILAGFVILILLVYYAWFWKKKKKTQSQQPQQSQ